MVLNKNIHLFFMNFTFAALNAKGLDEDLIKQLKKQAEVKSGITLEEILQTSVDAKEERENMLNE